MKTAIITGASSGLGAEFAAQLGGAFPEVECVWLIARRTDRLEKAAAAVSGEIKTRLLTLDLTTDDGLAALETLLKSESPDVRLLINNAGCGYLGALGETDTAIHTKTVDLNVRALTAVTNIVIPHISRGGRIINVSSIASFCPNPGMTVYSSTKAYVSSFTRGLNEELKPRGISVTAVCPGPMATEFLDLCGIKGNSRTFEILPYCVPGKVAAGTYKAAKHGRVIYTPRAFFKFYRVLAKLLPHALVVKLAKT